VAVTSWSKALCQGQFRGSCRRSRRAEDHAREQLAAWSTTWAPHLPGLPIHPGRLAETAAASDPPAFWAELITAARHHAQAARPDHVALAAAADTARQAY
jgi:hypothetical protein